MRSTAWLVAMGMAISLLGPAGCRPSRNDPAAPPEDAETGEPAASTTQAPASDDSTQEVAEAGRPTPSTPTEADAGATLSTIDRLWIGYRVAEGHLERLQRLDRLLQQYLDEHPDDPSALLLLASIRLEEDKLDEALAAADRCIAISPDSAGCWLTVGVVSETRGSVERALECYRQYLELAPDGRYAPDAREAIQRLEADRRFRS